MLVVGLTGGIASGKSTVSRRLKETHNITILDADQIARDIVQPGESAYVKIVDYFKDKIPDLLLPDNQLNRAALGQWVFNNKDELKELNNITHPAIRYAMFRSILYYYVKGYAVCVLDVPLLFEANLDLFCGITISVMCSRELQITRLKSRNPELSMAEIENRLNSQLSTEERVERSDYILQNASDLPTLYEQVDKLVERIKPSFARTALEYIPPLGVISAAATISSRRITRKWRSKQRQKEA